MTKTKLAFDAVTHLKGARAIVDAVANAYRQDEADGVPVDRTPALFAAVDNIEAIIERLEAQEVSHG